MKKHGPSGFFHDLGPGKICRFAPDMLGDGHMAEHPFPHRIKIDLNLNQTKLHLVLESTRELTLQFNSPSRRFYPFVIALVVAEMKRQGKLTSVPPHGQTALLGELNDTIGGTTGSSEVEKLLERISRKWQHALPNLETAKRVEHLTGEARRHPLQGPFDPGRQADLQQTVDRGAVSLVQGRPCRDRRGCRGPPARNSCPGLERIPSNNR